MNEPTTPIDLPTLDRLHAEATPAPWVATQMGGVWRGPLSEDTPGCTRGKGPLAGELFQCCPDDYECMGDCDDPDGQARADETWIATIHNTFPSLSARVKELEAQAQAHAWKVRDLETTVQNEHKLYADAHERMLKAFAENDLLKETLRGILQEKRDELASYGRPGPSFTRDRTIQQIAWLEQVLRGDK